MRALSLASTGSLHVVKERLGHDDIRTTINIYGHLLPSVDAGLADALDALHAESAAGNVTPLRPARRMRHETSDRRGRGRKDLTMKRILVGIIGYVAVGTAVCVVLGALALLHRALGMGVWAVLGGMASVIWVVWFFRQES